MSDYESLELVQGDEELRAIALTMRRLAVEAGLATLRFFRKADLRIDAKPDDSPVTEADLTADKLIADGLSAAHPDVTVITEERSTGFSGLLGAGARRLFMVDPLDGTKEFISGRGEYTVNIALIENGSPLLGAVYAPALDRLFWTPDPDFAIEEQGGVQAETIGPQRRLWVAEADNAAMRVVASRSHRDPETDGFLEAFSVAKLESAGSSLKFCLLACGEADLYPRLGRTMAWDTAAAHAVLRASGGMVRRLGEDGAVEEPLRYGSGQLVGPPFSNPHFVAFTPSVRFPKR
ncbi:MAG: 3'(2'),5'-bisphosphate nucleotidase CysQ [Pseudomonadota bacterium]